MDITPERDNSITAGNKVYHDKNRGREKLWKVVKKVSIFCVLAFILWELHRVEKRPSQRVPPYCLARIWHEREFNDKSDTTRRERESALNHVEHPKEHSNKPADKAAWAWDQTVSTSHRVYRVFIAEPNVERFLKEFVDFSYRGDKASSCTTEFCFFSWCHRRFVGGSSISSVKKKKANQQ